MPLQILMLPKEVKILIIDEVHQVLLDKLQSFNLHYMPEIEKETIKNELSDTHVLIMRSKLNIDRSWLDQAPLLRIIGRMGSGMDNIDLVEAESRSIICLNAPEGNRDAVAEHTIGMILALLNNFRKSELELKQGIWDRKTNSGVELNSLTVGIIGYGNTGSSLAAKLSGFGCRILAYDLYKNGFGSEQVEEVGLEQIRDQADIISLHVPLNDESEHLIDDAIYQPD